jgi:hypothetical protein
LGLTLFRTTWISPGNGKPHLGVVRLDLKGKDLPSRNKSVEAWKDDITSIYIDQVSEERS